MANIRDTANSTNGVRNGLTVQRQWDQTRGMYVTKIMPGEFYVTKDNELITTLLGSCVAVCMRDCVSGVGGMNHFKLPAPQGVKVGSIDANYGMYAMELLINNLLKIGGKRARLECRVYGGGNVLKTLDTNIGQKNIDFVTHFLRQEKIPVRHMDVGHESAQQIYFHPLSGNVFSIVAEQLQTAEIKRQEQEYLAKINQELKKNSVIFLDDQPPAAPKK